MQQISKEQLFSVSPVFILDMIIPGMAKDRTFPFCQVQKDGSMGLLLWKNKDKLLRFMNTNNALSKNSEIVSLTKDNYHSIIELRMPTNRKVVFMLVDNSTESETI